MKISIVVPVYNRERLVVRTLDSIKNQTYRPLQLILVDNGSKDNTMDVLKRFATDNNCADFEVKVVSEPRQGATLARNKGAREAEGEWLMFFDSDDVMDELLLEKYAAQITENIDVINVPVDISLNGKIWKPYFPSNNFLANHILHSSFSTQRYIMRKSIFEKAGGWNENLRGWNDWELGVRVLLLNPKVAQIKSAPLVHVLSHSDSITGNDFYSRHEWWESAVDEAQKEIESSALCGKEKLLKYLEVRRITLAALYKKEGHEDLAILLRDKVLQRIIQDKFMSCFMKILYRYISYGGRKATVLVKMLVR